MNLIVNSAAVLAVTTIFAGPARAGPGHDHGDAAPAVAGQALPRFAAESETFELVGVLSDKRITLYLDRFADNSPVRDAQIELEIGGAKFKAEKQGDGQVVMDPNAGGKVQPLNAGRIEPGPRGLPNPGQAVRKGEVLAYVVSSAAPIERSNQASQLAELRAARSLAEKRAARLKELADTVPRKDIEAAESEAQSLTDRIAALGSGVAPREALLAPVSGVIASANVVAGQVVDARELLFEIVDPARLRIEALAFDIAVTADIGGASIAVGLERVPLQFIGAARSLREQALPLVFRAEGKTLGSLSVGQPVRVFVQGKAQVQGIAVPVAALMRNPANQTIVWVKTAPERFEPRIVTTTPLDGVTVAVTSGLQAGDRVATQGATLINQVR